MKILIATGIYPPSVGGPATYSKLLFEQFSDWSKQFGQGDGQGDNQNNKKVEVSVYSYDEVRKYPRGLSHIVYLFGLLRRAWKFDFIYAQDPVSVGYPTMLASKILRRKYFLKIVGDFAWEQGVRRFGVTESLDEFVSPDFDSKGRYKEDVFRLKRVEKKVAQGAHKIIVPSQYLKKIVTAWGIDSEKIVVINNAFNGNDSNNKEFGILSKLSKEELKDELDLSGTNIISVGRLVPWKGFSGLIKTMPRLLQKFPDLKLHIVGDGTQRKDLEEIVAHKGLEKNIIFHGSLDQQKLFKYIKACDVFVLNTNYEGFSHQLLEVLALGIPIVTTNIGGNPEIIEDSKNGILVSYNERKEIEHAIEKIILNPDFSTGLVANGKETVAKYTVSKMFGELLKVLKDNK